MKWLLNSLFRPGLDDACSCLPVKVLKEGCRLSLAPTPLLPGILQAREMCTRRKFWKDSNEIQLAKVSKN